MGQDDPLSLAAENAALAGHSLARQDRASSTAIEARDRVTASQERIIETLKAKLARLEGELASKETDP